MSIWWRIALTVVGAILLTGVLHLAGWDVSTHGPRPTRPVVTQSPCPTHGCCAPECHLVP